MKRNKKPPRPSVKVLYYRFMSWFLYHVVRPVLQVFTNPVCNWIERRQLLLYCSRHSLQKARWLPDTGIDPSKTEPDLVFSAIQAGVWNLGWTYTLRYQQRAIKDLIAAGFLEEALAEVLKSDHPWEKRMAAEIRALLAGRPLAPVIEPAEGPICWSIEKALDEIPKWRKEDVDYAIAELYLRWKQRTAADGVLRLVRPKIWDTVMAKIKERFPEARTLAWYGSCACRGVDYVHVPLRPMEEEELKQALERKKPL